jgi:hypothetical protein
MTKTVWRPWPGSSPKPKRTRGQRIGDEHRDWLARRALEMRSQGMKLQDISNELGISLATAHKYAKGEA